MAIQVIQQVEEFAIRYCKDEILKSGYPDYKLWEDHVQLVRKYALLLAKIEKVNPELLEIAALLHDIGKYKGREDHETRSYELSKGFLAGLPLSEEEKTIILKCILKHSSKYANEGNEIEVKVLQCADALGTLFDEDWQEYSRKTLDKEILLGLYDKTYNKITLESARKLAKPQVDKLRKILMGK